MFSESFFATRKGEQIASPYSYFTVNVNFVGCAKN